MEEDFSMKPILSNPLSRPRRSADLDPSYPWVRYAVAGAAAVSLFGILLLILILAVPISMIVIGVRYRYEYDCPIEPRLSRFLIVGGSVSIVWIVITIIVSLITMFFSYTRSIGSVICVIILIVITFLGQIFSLIWLIIGSVWTFSIRSRVQYRDPFFYYRSYCNQTLYQFTFAYLILIYVLIALQLLLKACTAILRNKQRK
jgi:hypothetical protein